MRQTLSIGLTAILLTSVLAGCGSDSSSSTTPACVDTICSPGESLCLGNVAATCSDDGKQWQTTACGTEQGCKAGVCEARDARCYGASSQSFCVEGNVRALIKCAENGTSVTSTNCDLSCAGGACREAPCEPNTTVCGYRSIATCQENGVSWTHTNCGPTEICVAGECTEQICEPQSRGCKDEATVMNCNAEGSGYNETTCADDEACVASTGTCEKTLCSPPAGTDGTDGTDAPDAGGTDGSDGADDVATEEDTYEPPELEPLDTAFVNVNGVKLDFTSNKGANYVVADQDLRITMDKGQTKIEISIAPIEEFDVGVFASTEASDVNVRIFYHDGSPLSGMAQFRYQSVDYYLDLESFQSKGGRVKGTFEGTFTEDGGATTIPFEGGTFDVKRNL